MVHISEKKGGERMKQVNMQPELSVECGRLVQEMFLQGERVLNWELTWPECSGSWRGLKAVMHYYRRRTAVWRGRWEKELYTRACLDLAQRRAQGRPFRPWQARLETHVTWQEGGLLSLWQEAAEYWGYNRPLVLRTGDTWSLQEGTPRALASFFPGQRHWKRQVLGQIARQAEQRLAGGESLLDPDCADRLRRYFDADSYVLTPQGVQVFYPMYVLAPGAEGIPAFTIPLTQL